MPPVFPKCSPQYFPKKKPVALLFPDRFCLLLIVQPIGSYRLTEENSQPFICMNSLTDRSAFLFNALLRKNSLHCQWHWI
jgi:hypothetical protein